ncbi:MAG: GNAT family N-acetyltransferase [Alphaproteobacteria bacterium]|nr:GNAT family N-acetyltransferase [Alphaproteobacteria bacterium]
MNKNSMDAAQPREIPAFTTRLAEPGDLDICVAFDCTDPTDSRRDQEKVDLIRARIDSQEIFLAVTPEGSPIGYVAIDRLWPMMLPLLSWVYVAPAWRTYGVAAALVDFCFHNLKSRQYKRVLLSTQTDRPQMIETMRAMGLKEIGTLKANPDENVGEVFFIREL